MSYLAESDWKAHRSTGLMEQLGPLLSQHNGAQTVYALRMDERHVNPAGLVHGGTLMTLADHALSIAAWEHSERRTPCVTVQFDMHFLNACHQGQLVIVQPEITRAGASLFFMQAHLYADQTPIATAMAVLKPVVHKKATT